MNVGVNDARLGTTKRKSANGQKTIGAKNKDTEKSGAIDEGQELYVSKTKKVGWYAHTFPPPPRPPPAWENKVRLCVSVPTFPASLSGIPFPAMVEHPPIDQLKGKYPESPDVVVHVHVKPFLRLVVLQLLGVKSHLLVGVLVSTAELADLLAGSLVILHRASETGLGAITGLGDELPVDKQPRGVVGHRIVELGGHSANLRKARPGNLGDYKLGIGKKSAKLAEELIVMVLLSLARN